MNFKRGRTDRVQIQYDAEFRYRKERFYEPADQISYIDLTKVKEIISYVYFSDFFT